MCSIYGAIGPTIDDGIFNLIREAARDRGRDGGRHEHYTTKAGLEVILGNWRATPTPEIEVGRLQPYDGLVHNEAQRRLTSPARDRRGPRTAGPR